MPGARRWPVDEAEWLSCEHAYDMVGEWLRRMSNRKRRLFAVACARRVVHLLPLHHLEAIEAAELYADGRIEKATLQEAHKRTWATARGPELNATACAVARQVSRLSDSHAAWLGSWKAADVTENHDAERKPQADLLRDILGNPYHPVILDPTWLTPTVRSLSQGIYDERAFDRMPILADALEDAGCSDLQILEHCRGKGPHARGCFVVDIILGKV
jgi:hypothetical protein